MLRSLKPLFASRKNKETRYPFVGWLGSVLMVAKTYRINGVNEQLASVWLCFSLAVSSTSMTLHCAAVKRLLVTPANPHYRQ
jgi:hypothetical protein